MQKFALLLVLLLTSCGRQSQEHSSSSAEFSATDQNLPKIVAFGNSLTAGLGLPAAQSYPAVLQNLLQKDGYKYEVVNAGVSGDTTAGGLRRLDWSLEGDVKFLILELGANDILRGQSVELMKENLSEMIRTTQSRSITVLLAQMEAPANAGPDYRKEVHQAFLDLAEEHEIVLIPFILKNVVGAERLIQEDGTHPTAEGARVIAEHVYESLRPLLR
jgi:acyl-CoA thioesterase-1